MIPLNPTSLGLIFLFLGFSFLGVACIFLRKKRLPPGLASNAQSSSSRNHLEFHSDGILLIQSGGRILFSNLDKLDWIEFSSDEIDLNHLLHRFRPGDVFLNLCTIEGRAQLSVGDQNVEVYSYRLPHGSGYAMLVCIKQNKEIIDDTEDTDKVSQNLTDRSPSGDYLKIFAEINQAIVSESNLESILAKVLEGIERLVPAEFSEILIIENESQVVSYKLQRYASGEPYLVQNYVEPNRTSSTQAITLGSNLLISQIGNEEISQPEIQHFEIPIRSYLRILIRSSDTLIGAIELGSLSANALNENDLELLTLLSSIISNPIKNSLTFNQENLHSDELDDLIYFLNSANHIQNPEESFSRLVDSLAQSLESEILGFLLFDEDQKTLRGQTPFRGIPDEFVTQYEIEINKNSEINDLIQTNEPILTENAIEDTRIIGLKLQDLAIASGMRQTILYPLTKNQHFLGFLLSATHLDKPTISPRNQQLVESIAIQVTPIVENIMFFQQSQLRIQRAEAMRQIANLTGSQSSMDEILRQALAVLAQLIQADIAAIYLLDENEQALCLHEPSRIGISFESSNQLANLKTNDLEFFINEITNQEPFVIENITEDSNLLSLYGPFITLLNIVSTIIVPLSSGNRGIGEILFGSTVPGHFKQADLVTLKTTAIQLAGAIERCRLASLTDEGLQNKVNQLTAVTQISRELNSSLDLGFLIQKIHSDVLKATGADGGTVLLLEQDQTTSTIPKIAIYFGENPSDLYVNERTTVIQSKKPLIVADWNAPRLPSPSIRSGKADRSVRISPRAESLLIVPIIFQDHVLGFIELHSKHFDDTPQEIAFSLANQAAIALSNALQYEELIRQNTLLNRRIDLLAKLVETNQSLEPDLPIEQSLMKIASGIQESTPFNIVLISILDQQTQNLIRTSSVGLSTQLMATLRATQQPWKGIQNLLRDEFRLGNAFFIPYEKMPIMPVDVHALVPISFDIHPDEPDDWHPEDALIIPLLRPDGSPLGLISVDDPRDGKRPDRTTLESLEIFASQAAFLIDVEQKIHNLQEQSTDLQHKVQVLEINSEKSSENLTILKQMQIDQNEALQDLEHSRTKLRIVLEIADLASRQSDQSSLLNIIGKAFQERIGLNFVVVAENSLEGLRIIHRQGILPENAILETLLGQQNPIMHCFSTNEILIVPDITLNEKWARAYIFNSLGIRSFITFPVQIDSKIELVFLAASNSINQLFKPGDEEILQIVARQISSALKKLNLLTESQRRIQEIELLLEFTRQIDSLDPSHLLQALVDCTRKVVPSAQASSIALWQPYQNILIPKFTAGFIKRDCLFETTIPVDHSLPGRAFAQKQSLRVEEVDFVRDYPLTSDNLLRYQEASGGRLPVSSLVVPILVSKYLPDLQENSPYDGVLILDNYSTTGAFTKEDQALATSLAQQAALTLANYGLFEEAEQRASQLKALTRVSTTITSSLHQKPLLSSLLDHLQSVVPYDTGTLWVRYQDTLVVLAARGFDDTDNRLGLSVNVDDSILFREMVELSQPIYIGDTRNDARFAGLGETQYHTWLGLPLNLQGNVIGVIALEKSESNYYRDQELELLMTFASQAAASLENARLFEESIHQNQELDKNSRRANLLSHLSIELNSTLEIDEILNLSSEHLIEAIHCSGISIVTFEHKLKAKETGELGSFSPLKPQVIEEYPRRSPTLPIALHDLPLFSHLAQTIGVFSSEDYSQDQELNLIKDYLEFLEVRSLFVLPMVIENEIHSLWIIYSKEPRHFLQDEFNLARTVINQTAISLEKARLFTEIRGFSQDLELRVAERTAELAYEHQKAETLLRLSTDLSASLNIDYIIERTLSILKETTDATHISCLVWRPGEDKLRHAASIGYTGIAPMKGKPLALRKDQGLIGWIISNRRVAIINDVLEDSRWIQLPDTKLLHRSAIGIPLIVGEELLGAIFLFHPEVGHFSEDELDLVQAAANQISMAINNAELYNLISEQAEELSGLLRQQKVETSQSRAILEAVAEGVLVTDASGRVMLFNDSAGMILDLHRDQVVGSSIDHLMGIFGRVGYKWIETIQHWTQEPSSSYSWVSYTEQLSLDNGNVVSVNLAPVLFQNEFLGTVSIFHDITHQVEVDRLKSEFVATVSHELRTPMTSIKGYVEILLMGAAGALNPQQIHFLEIVKNNNERLGILVNDLLDLSRIEAGKIDIAFQPMDIYPLAEGALADFRQRSNEENKPMQFSLTIPANLPRVMGDPERIRQIITNLLENAFDYTPAYGEIKLSASQSNGSVQIDVIDNGIGIPLSEQSRIFERFYRGEDSLVLASSGTGLGLNIVQQLVSLHNGRIWFSSSGKPGEGSRFSFTIPAYQQPARLRENEVV